MLPSPPHHTTTTTNHQTTTNNQTHLTLPRNNNPNKHERLNDQLDINTHLIPDGDEFDDFFSDLGDDLTTPPDRAFTQGHTQGHTQGQGHREENVAKLTLEDDYRARILKVIEGGVDNVTGKKKEEEEEEERRREEKRKNNLSVNFPKSHCSANLSR